MSREMGGRFRHRCLIIFIGGRKNVTEIKHVYEVRPRKDDHCVDLISDVLPFGRLW